MNKIIKKNKKLGRYNKQLVIRLTKEKKSIKGKTTYHIILTRRRNRPGSRYDKLGFYECFKEKKRSFNVIGLNRKKIKSAMAMGAIFHISVYKILYN